MVEGKRRCHSTSEAPLLITELDKLGSWDDPFCYGDEEDSSSEAVYLLPPRK